MYRQSGFSLIEIMISLVLGLIVVAAIGNIYISTVGSSSSTIKSSRLNHDMESLMVLMTNDIRRAGYWAGAGSEIDSRDNPFTSPTNNLAFYNTGSCVVYSYDSDDSGVVNEYFGFRLNNNSIEMRVSGTTNQNCNDGTWQEFVVSNQVAIQNVTIGGTTYPGLQFTANYKCLNYDTMATYDNACSSLTAAQLPSGNTAAETRSITITVSGIVNGDASVRKTLSNVVKLGNDRIFIQP